MDMVDCHVHIDGLDQYDLGLMALAGVKIVIGHVADTDIYGNLSSQALSDYYDRLLSFHTWRVSQFFIDAYVCVAVSMVGVPTDYGQAIERLRHYLSHERVVGIGEIGLEPSSRTCPDLTKQQEILKAQLHMAREYGKAVDIHTPMTEKPKWVEYYLTIVRELKLDPSKVVIDHADASVVKMITDSGCNAAITVEPCRRLAPTDAARIVQNADLDLVLVDSDSNSIDESDSLAVPKTAFEMRKLGIKESDIKKIVWENPRRVFSLD